MRVLTDLAISLAALLLIVYMAMSTYAEHGPGIALLTTVLYILIVGNMVLARWTHRHPWWAYLILGRKPRR